MANLFDIDRDIRSLLELIEDTDVDEVQTEIIKYLLDESEGDRAHKIDNYCEFILELIATAEAKEERAKRLQEQAKVKRNLADRLKENLKKSMEARGEKKIETARHNLGIRKHGGKKGILLTKEIDHIPSSYLIPDYKINNDAIRHALETGDEKVKEFAQFKERGESLVIR